MVEGLRGAKLAWSALAKWRYIGLRSPLELVLCVCVCVCVCCFGGEGEVSTVLAPVIMQPLTRRTRLCSPRCFHPRVGKNPTIPQRMHIM